MSSGFSPPPYKPPDSAFNPLTLIGLLQDKQRMELQQQKFHQERADRAFATGLDMINNGADAKNVIGMLSNDGLTYDRGQALLEMDKAKKKQEREKLALSDQGQAAFMQANAPTLGTNGEVVPPPESQVGASRDIWSSFAYRPEVQTYLNQLASAAQSKGAQQGAEFRASEAADVRATNRRTAATMATQANADRLDRERSVFVQRLQAEGEKAKAKRESLVNVAAFGDKAQRDATLDYLSKAKGPGTAARIWKDLTIEAQGKRAEMSAKLATTEANSPGERFAQLRERIRTNPNDQAALDRLEGSGMAVRLPFNVPGAPAAANYAIGKGAQDNPLYKQSQIVVQLDGQLRYLDSLFNQAETDPEAQKQLRGAGGTEFVRNLGRFSGTRNPLAAKIESTLVLAQKSVAAIGNVGQISDREQLMASYSLPAMTEIIGPDGKVTPAARARIQSLQLLSDVTKRALVDPNIRAQLERETQQALSAFTPEQRKALQAYADVMKNDGTPEQIRNAYDRAKSTGALDVSLQQEHSRLGVVKSVIDKQADELMKRIQTGGPGAR